MLTDSEQRFLKYWKENRGKEKKTFRQLMLGMPLGLLIGAGIFVSVATDTWYQRAEMVANAELNPNVLIIAIFAIAVFTGLFYKKFKWDQNEQLYKELTIKQQREEKEKGEENSENNE